jgi:uncharacterized membrane protein YeaQ/YmgE (transglycosylase-associated protein family)
MISVFATALLGLVIGILGKAIMPSNDRGGVMATAVCGICGGSLVGSMGWLMDWWTVGAPMGYAAAAGGALFLLIIYRIVSGLETAVE